MNGIIAEIHNSHMIVITKKGDFIKCKKLPNCQIGDEVNIPKTTMAAFYKRLSAVAAGLIIFAMLSTGVYAYYTPYSYISMDINPSLELYVNRFNKVIGAHAFNEDAQKLIEATKDIKNKDVDTALENILDSAADRGYLKKDAENSVMFVVSSDNAKEEAALADIVSNTSSEMLANISSDYEVILEKANVEAYKKAKEGNVSPGKVILADKFNEVKPDLDKEKIKQMPLQQAIKQIEKVEDKAVKPDKPAAVNNNAKPQSKKNVMDVKELIKEKNDELGKKLDKQNNDDKDKQKNNGNESFNQNEQQDKSQKDIDKETEKVDDKSDKGKDNESINQSIQQDKSSRDTKDNKSQINKHN